MSEKSLSQISWSFNDTKRTSKQSMTDSIHVTNQPKSKATSFLSQIRWSQCQTGPTKHNKTNRIYHWCSLGTGKSQHEDPTFQWATCLVSQWSGGPEVWHFPIVTENKWSLVYFTCRQENSAFPRFFNAGTKWRKIKMSTKPTNYVTKMFLLFQLRQWILMIDVFICSPIKKLQAFENLNRRFTT